MNIANMRVEYQINPLGIESLQPRLSWILETKGLYDVQQKSYQIFVASSKEKLFKGHFDLWDSGKVDSNESVQIQYKGKKLYSGQYCYWKVRIWTNKNPGFIESDICYWSMGLLSTDHWKAEWIGLEREKDIDFIPARYLRKEFRIDQSIKKAIVYSTALGVYELHFNGQKVNNLFSPGWTDYAKCVQYETHDVTHLISQGSNAIGIVLGSGWYCGHIGMTGTCWYGDTPYALLQLHIEYDDGSTDEIVTNQSWRVTTGPLLYSEIIMGEMYDSTKELGNWNKSEYNDSLWSKPKILSTYKGQLKSILEPPIRIIKEIKPKSVTKTPRGSYIFDMGQNMVGWSSIKVRGPKGHKITLSYAEMLNEDGTLYIDNLRDAKQVDHYILSGSRQGEIYEPHFTFHGFRYVEVLNPPCNLTAQNLIGKVIHSETPRVGNLKTSDPMINQLYQNIIWGQRGNFLSIPTDCPQRDERLGWTGDAQIFFRTASYNMDVAQFFTKYLQDVVDAQLPTGAFPDVAPDGGWIWYKTTVKEEPWLAPDNAGWGDAGVIIPWAMYCVYNDKKILEQMYPSMKKWIFYLKERSNNYIRPDHGDYGDWLSINSVTPNEVVNTAYFAYSTFLMSKIAEILDEKEESKYYQKLFKKIKKAFNRTFVDSDGRIYGDSQTVYILALRFNLLEENQKKKALRHLVENIREMDNHLTTGFLGVGHILPVLSDHGEDDLAYKLLKQENFPSWLYSVKHGATTIWERWDGWTEKNGFQTPRTNSFNHYALGSVGEWMYRYMAGIDAKKSGFRHIIIRPRIWKGLSYVEASYHSIYGEITSSWEIKNEKGVLIVNIPANTSADIYIPNMFNNQIECESYQLDPIEKLEDGTVLFQVNSGQYKFVF